MNATDSVDAQQSETSMFLNLLFPNLDAEERIEGRWKRAGAEGSMFRDFFLTPDEFARKAFSIASTHETYVGVAARRGNVGTKDGVEHLRGVWGDLDFKEGHTPESRDSQLRALDCVPSMLVLSGGGCQPYWMFEDPIEGPEWLNRAEMVMARIAEGLDGDPVQDRSRILRVPGTYNHKTGKPRPVRLAHCDPNLRYTLDRLEQRDGNEQQKNRGQDEDAALDRVAVGGYQYHRQGGRPEGRGTGGIPRVGEGV